MQATVTAVLVVLVVSSFEMTKLGHESNSTTSGEFQGRQVGERQAEREHCSGR